jgi:hypothetical protein
MRYVPVIFNHLAAIFQRKECDESRKMSTTARINRNQKSHGPQDLMEMLVKRAHSRMRDEGHFLQLSLTIFKYVTVM